MNWEVYHLCSIIQWQINPFDVCMANCGLPNHERENQKRVQGGL